jgi:hypothetical protein
MEGVLHRAGALATLAAVVLTASPAVARDPSATVITSVTGVTVILTTSGATPGAGRGGGTDGGCLWTVKPADLGGLGGAPGGTIDTHPSDYMPYLLACNGVFVKLIWLPPSAAGVVGDPRAMAEQLIRHIPVPTTGIGTNPATGLAGIAGWFWGEGYDGAPIERNVSAFGLSVDVVAVPTAVTWAFGDGTSETGDLGRAYPTRSSVTHVYETAGPKPLTMTFDFAVRYRVNGGSWLLLPDIQRAQTTTYPVASAQAIGR